MRLPLAMTMLFACSAASHSFDRARAAGTDGASKQKITHEFLISQGFKRDHDEIYVLGPIRVGDAAKRLGFSLTDMRHTLNQSGFTDIRTVDIGDLGFVVRSLKKNTRFEGLRGSLDKPDCPAEISVALNQVKEKLPAECTPTISIRKVAIPADASKPIVVVIQIAAKGAAGARVSFSQQQFCIGIFSADNRRVWFGDVQFSKEVPAQFTIVPDAPKQFTVAVRMIEAGRVAGDTEQSDAEAKLYWSRLPPGEYSICAYVEPEGHLKDRGRRFFDYQWVGTCQSEPYDLVFE